MATVLNILLEITIYSVILYLAILLFKKVFHKHISAILNYAVWGLLILRLLIPVTIDSGLHFFVIPEATTQVAQTEFNSTDESMTVQEELDTLALDQYATQSVANENAVGRALNNAVNDNDVDVSKPASWKLSWQTVLVLLWTTGVFGSLIYMTVLWLQLHRNIKRHRIRPPEYVLKLVETCKKDLGINAGIDVSIQSWLTTPALCASLKPKLLLPKSMLDKMGRQQIEFGIRHELTHYRRKDHLTHLLLVFLRCVYWFNPVVWLASRQIKTDMETACDASVTLGLKNKDRTRYIRTMIDLSGDMDAQYILGMGLDNERRSMEKRVRGMFMKKKTKSSVRMVTVLLACVMAMVCFTTACQPTPEKEIVVNKGDNQLEEAISQGKPVTLNEESETIDKESTKTDNNRAKMIVEQHWKEDTLNKPYLELSVDAKVFTPDVEDYITYEIYPTSLIPNSVIKDVIMALTNGKTTLREGANPSKDDLESTLIRLQKLHSDLTNAPESVVNPNDYNNIEDYNEFISGYSIQVQDQITETEQKLLDDSFEESREFSIDDENSWPSPFRANINLGGTSNATFSIMNKAEEFAILKEINFFASEGNFSMGNVGSLDTEFLSAPEIVLNVTESEALNTANELLKNAGLINYDIKIMGVERKYIPTSFSDQSNPQGYMMYFERIVNGMPVSVADRYSVTQLMESGTDEAYLNDYTMKLVDEYLTIAVNDAGVDQFNLHNYYEIDYDTARTVEIKSFEEIKDIIIQQLYNKYSYSDNANNKKMSLDVTRVELVMGRIPIKDNLQKQWLVPIWNVYGDLEYSSDEKIQSQLVLSINAIDGSIL